MKLRFFLKNKKKIYTLKNTKETKDAHYKFKKAPTLTRTSINYKK